MTESQTARALEDYLPFLAAGLVIWTFIAGIVADGCNACRPRRSRCEACGATG